MSNETNEALDINEQAWESGLNKTDSNNQLLFTLLSEINSSSYVDISNWLNSIDSLSDDKLISQLKSKFGDDSINWENISKLLINWNEIDSFDQLSDDLRNWILLTLRKKLINAVNHIWLESEEENRVIEEISALGSIEELKHYINDFSNSLNHSKSEYLDLSFNFTIWEVVDNIQDPDTKIMIKRCEWENFTKVFNLSATTHISRIKSKINKDISEYERIYDIPSVKSFIWEANYAKLFSKKSVWEFTDDERSLLLSKWIDLSTASDNDKETILKANLFLIEDDHLSSEKKEILLTLIDNDFDFSVLQDEEKSKLIDYTFESTFNERNVRSILTRYFRFSEKQIDEYYDFYTNFFSPNINKFSFKIWYKTYQVQFANKELSTSTFWEKSLDWIEDSLSFSFNYQIDIDNTDKELINILIYQNLIDDDWKLSQDWLKNISKIYLFSKLSYWPEVDTLCSDLNSSDEDSEELSWNFESIELNKIKDFWKDLEWDKNVEFSEWSVLSFRMSDSAFPWWWARWWFIQFLEEPKVLFNWKVRLKIAVYSWEDSDNCMKQEYSKNLDITADQLESWLDSDPINWTAMRFKWLNNFISFTNYIWVWDETDDNLSLKTNYRNIKSWKELWSWIKLNWWSLVNRYNNEEIKYIWKKSEEFDKESWKTNQFALLYQIEFRQNTVLLSNKDMQWDIEMDYNSFLLFCFEKWLSPYSEAEATELEQSFDSKSQYSWERKFLSIWALISAPKKIWQNYLDSWKEEMDFRETMFTYKLFNIIPWFDHFDELDSKIWSRINKSKDKLSHEWAIDDKKISEMIEWDVFDNYWKIHKKDPWKAAWYLLHAVENAWSPYYANLQKYAWTWKWVGCILWPEFQSEFKAQAKTIINDLKKNPSNTKLQNDLARLEMQFIVEKTKSMPQIFGSKFAWVLDKWMQTSLFWEWKVKETHDALKWKPDFESVYNDYLWALKSAVPSKQIWALRALSEKIDDDSHYNRWFWAMIMPLMSWDYYMWDSNMKAEYIKIAWTYALPLWLFYSSASWAEKLWKLMDYITKWKFSSSVWWSSDKVSYDNMWSNRQWIINNFDDWWKLSWQEVIKFLNMDDISWNSPISILSKDSSELSDQEREIYPILEEYKEFIIDKDKKLSVDDGLDPNEAVPYKRAIFNMPPKVADKYMRNHDWSNLIKPLWNWLWKILSWKIKDIKEDTSNNPQFKLVLNKYSTWFNENHYNWWVDIIQCFIQASRNKNLWKSDVSKEFESLFYQAFGRTNQFKMPQSMKQWLDNFIEYFSNNVNNMSEEDLKVLLKEVFDESKVDEAIWDLLEKKYHYWTRYKQYLDRANGRSSKSNARDSSNDNYI